ncbi:F0F1 ATP synthase subunit delta [Altererythrobacter indicus]|uniref:ATP synthase subunit delta n=1 Tax=Altericroceibacterium indicum TaxID=374177 RepID=A0A845AAM3_9SPHN|nr:F0F1 ATP synthase subunit delta [Altericroceibacterium indicum]
MELSAGIQASLAGRYALALFDLASESGNVTAVEADLVKLKDALAESAELRALIHNPEISRADLGKVMNGIAELLAISPITRNFLGVLAENRRVTKLAAIIRAFQTIAAEQRGEVTAEVATAHALSADQIASLEQKLKAREGRNVKIHTSVDPDLLGGLVVTIGSKRVDNSIRTRLNTLAHAMKG